MGHQLKVRWGWHLLRTLKQPVEWGTESKHEVVLGGTREQIEGISEILMILLLLQNNGRSLKDFKRGETWSGKHFKQLTQAPFGEWIEGSRVDV